MAASGYSPIQLYYSTTASTAPAAGNLVSGELAINITDGKLYYKDNAGVVQLLSTSTTANGTANGVLYLNGSKVATTDPTKLSFDGTNLGLGTSSPSAIGAGYPTLDIRGSAGGGQRWGNSTDSAYIYSNSNETNLATATNKPLLFSINASEVMRLTSTSLYTASGINVGIGTSSPASKFSAYYGSTLINAGVNYGLASTLQTGTGTFNLTGSNARGIGVLINSNANQNITIPYGGDYEVYGLLSAAKAAAGGGYTLAGVAGYGESDGTAIGVRADAFNTNAGGAGNAYGLYVGSVTGALNNYGIYINDTSAKNYIGGNLGIGTSSPVARQQIRGSGTSGQVTASWILENASSGTVGMDIIGAAGASRWRFLYGGGPGTGTNSLTEAMCIGTEGSSAGNVGIGTSSPGSKLAVVGSANLAYFYDGSSSDLQFQVVSSRTVVGTTTPSSLVFKTNNTERAFLDSSGNLGLGVTPSAWSSSVRAIQLGGSNGYISYSNISGGYLYWNMYNDGSNNVTISTGNIAAYGLNTSGGHVWFTGTGTTGTNATGLSQVMTLDASGRLGIGQTSPLAVVHTASSGLGDTGGIKIQNTGSGGATFAIWPTATVNGEGAGKLIFSGPSGNIATLDSSGNLLVGLTSPESNAQSGAGNIHASTYVNAHGYRSRSGTSGSYQANNFNFQWTGSPALWVDTTNLGNIQLSSDYRIKKNIETQVESGIERVMQLRPVVYELADYGDLFKSDGIQREGFIAHEVQEVIPSGAEGEKDEEGRIQNLRVDAILSVVVKAMQEQQALIQQLTARVAQLESN